MNKILWIIVALSLTVDSYAAFRDADSLIACKFIIGRYYFTFTPMGVEKDSITLYKLPNGKTVFEVHHPEHLTAADLRYAVPENNVKDLELLKEYKTKGIRVMSALAVTPVGANRLKIGDQIGRFSIKDVEGNLFSDKSTRGKPLVLNFWFTGCGPCIKEMPEINRWMESVPDATYLAVTYNTPQEIKEIVERQKFRFHQIADDTLLKDMFGVEAYPVTVIVDKEGIVKYVMDGTNPQKRDFLLRLLQQIASE